MRRIIIHLTAATCTLGCTERPDAARARSAPAGWVAVDPAKPDSRAAQCGNWARDAWDVSLESDSNTVSFKPVSAKPQTDTLMVDDGIISGDDVGEFGGAIWWQGPDGRRDTLRVEGRESRSFYADNLHGFLRRGGAAYALLGLAHMSLDAGEVVRVSKDSGSAWHARHVMDIGGAPAAFMLMGADSALILTSDSLVAVKFGSTLSHRVLHGNPEWAYLYGSSLVRDRAGVIYVGMRSAVARLTPEAAGYREEWLVPAKCRTRVPIQDSASCRCEPGN